MKIKYALLAAVIVMFVFTTVQAQVQVSSTPVTSIRSDGKTEKTGNVVLSFTGTTPASGTDVITLDYGVAVDITTATATKTAGIAGTTVGTITKSGNIVSVPLTFSAAQTGTLTVSGVRVNVAGSTLTNLSVTVSTTSVPIVAGQNTTRVVNAIAAPTTAGATTDAKAAILDEGTVVVTTGVLTVKENFASAWTSSAQEGAVAGVTNGYTLQLRTAGTIPTGVTLTLGQGSASTVSGTVTFAPTQLTSAATKAIVSMPTYVNAAAKETLYIEFTVSVKASGTGAITKPLANGSITATVESAPVDTATTKIPRFTPTAVPATAQVVFNIISTESNILFTFTTWDSSINFDTGIDIANTSNDPFIVNGASATAGIITYHFYPRGGGAAFSYATTAGSPGSGLDATGQVASGGSHTVLLSELVAAAGQTGPFTGYIIAVCGFTHGHGEGFILDGAVIAQTLNGLIIPSPGSVTRTTGGTGETLGR